VIRAGYEALRPGGRFIFTLEKIIEPKAGEEIRLNTHGRYSHSRQYVEKTLTDAGLDVLRIDQDTLRKEAKNPVTGLVITALRP
jgi:predicted TPR repeat methyltransferase